MAVSSQCVTEVLGTLTRVVEDATGALKDGGAVWEATLVTPGKGTSGDYTEELLASSTRAFVAAEDSPEGIATKNFFRHPQIFEDRDPRDQWGFVVKSSWYEEGVGLKAHIRILPHWREVVESLANEGQAQLSIYAAAAINEETGELVAILPAVDNAVDLVHAPGRPGSELARKIESARAHKPDAAPAQEDRKKATMDEKALEAVVTRLLEAKLAPIVTFVESTKAAKVEEAQATVDETALGQARKEAVEAYRAADKLISDADLLAPQVEELRARAVAGEDITNSIESAKAIKEAAVKAASEGAANGIGTANGGTATEDWTVRI